MVSSVLGDVGLRSGVTFHGQDGIRTGKSWRSSPVPLNLAITATAMSGAMLKQTVSIVLGLLLFTALGLYLRGISTVSSGRVISWRQRPSFCC